MVITLARINIYNQSIYYIMQIKTKKMYLKKNYMQVNVENKKNINNRKLCIIRD